MKNVLIALGMSALFAVAACDKPASQDVKTEDKNATTTTNATATAATTAVTPAPAPAPVTISDGDLSTPADFEETAEKAITAKTYKAELATLESDLAKDKE